MACEACGLAWRKTELPIEDLARKLYEEYCRSLPGEWPQMPPWIARGEGEKHAWREVARKALEILES